MFQQMCVFYVSVLQHEKPPLVTGAISYRKLYLIFPPPTCIFSFFICSHVYVCSVYESLFVAIVSSNSKMPLPLVANLPFSERPYY